jgi:NAD+ synthase (glutamine-hydrolysing)
MRYTQSTMRTLRVGMAQINSIVGDIPGNTRKICDYIRRARALEADVVIFPELALVGYPPEDLLLRPYFIQDNLKALKTVIRATAPGEGRARSSSARDGITAVVGFVDRREDSYNAAAVIHHGRLADVYHKMHLPNYGVFDEQRYFQAGHRPMVFVLNGITFGVNVCEDIWHPDGPILHQSLAGDAEVILNINASPYHAMKWQDRLRMLSTRASDNTVAVAYVNLVGGQDELVFDGYSFIMDQEGRPVASGPQFEEALIVADLDVEAVFRRRLHDTRRRQERLALEKRGVTVEKIVLSSGSPRRSRRRLAPETSMRLGPSAEIYQALVLGVRDYVRKNGFEKAVIGMSGGIDSALTTVIAVDALGPKNVIGVFMPSRYTSVESREDAEAVAEAMGIRLITLPITGPFDAYLDLLSPAFKGHRPDKTEENLQARVRGMLLMALSNKFGWLVLTTGNKSEMSVGYATLYGDMAGGFAVIKDVFKTVVYELARYRNSQSAQPVIPERVLKRPPTAELRLNQTDQDTLPPYEILDPILRAYVEEERSPEEIVPLGFDRRTVDRVVAMVDASEYKRRQAPPGVKITPRALGKDRRLPITNRYRP